MKRNLSASHWKKPLAVAWLAALVLGGLMGSASAECTNYENYRHWTGSLVVRSEIMSLCVQDDYEFIVVQDYAVPTTSALIAVDIANKSVPVAVDTLAIPGLVEDVAVAGSLAVVACVSDTTSGFYVVDVSDPLSTEIVGSALPGEGGTLVALSDTIAYVVCCGASVCSLHVVDVSDPAHPSVRSSVSLPYTTVKELLLLGDYAYIGGTKLLTVNVADPDAAYHADTDEYPGEAIMDIAINGDCILAVTGRPGPPARLEAYSLADPGDPLLISDVTVGSTLPPGNASIAIAADVCYIDIPGIGGILPTYDISDPLDMSFYGFLHTSVSIDAKCMMVFGHSLFLVYSPGPPTSLVLTYLASSPDPLEPISSVDTPGDALGVALPAGRSDLAYVADGDEGVQIVDITDPMAPVIVDWVDTPGYASDIVMVGTIAYVADREAGLQVIDTSIPGVIGSVDTPGMAVDLAVGDTLVYLADSSGGMRIIDISTPASPVLRGAATALADARGVDVSGLVAMVADHGQGLQSVDVSDPDNPWIIDGVKERAVANASKVDVVDNRAYVTDDSLGLVIVDVSDPSNLSVLSSLITDDTTGDVKMLGLFVLVGSGDGLQVIDVQEDTSPEVVGGLDVPAVAKGIFAGEHYAYVAAGASGLQICPTQCGYDESVLAQFVALPYSGFLPLEVSFYDESVGYAMSYLWDFGDGVGTSTEASPQYTYTEPGDFLVLLEVTNGTNTSRDSLWVSALTESPTVVSIYDVPDDQGGHVYAHFYHSGYDDSPPSGSETYTIQRELDREWVSVDTVDATGQHYYTRALETPGDGIEHETQFRVVAHMSEGDWTSDPMSGFSLDNIAPQVPENLNWLTWGHLAWDVAPDIDFAYFRVYGSPTSDFGDAELLMATVDPETTVDPAAYAWFFITAVDEAELESEPAAAPEETGIDDVVTKVELSQAVPSPFNPSTVIGYAIPADGHVQLRIYDVSGRVVRTLVNRETPAGRHGAIWRGRDDSGRTVASGIYFYQLETDGKTLRKSMTLLK